MSVTYIAEVTGAEAGMVIVEPAPMVDATARTRYVCHYRPRPPGDHSETLGPFADVPEAFGAAMRRFGTALQPWSKVPEGEEPEAWISRHGTE